MMNPKTVKLCWRLLALLYLGAVAYLCFGHLSPDESLPRAIFGIPSDKIAHFAMFFPFPIIAIYAFHNSKGRPGRFFVFLAISYFLGMLLAMGTELIQGTTDYRSSDILDLVADSLGLMTGCVAVTVIKSFGGKW